MKKSSTLSIYTHPRIMLLLFLGFSSGLPLALTLSTLTIWLAEIGITKTSIGLFALAGLPYTIKFLWAPLVDNMSLPILGKLLGRRRSWALLAQAGLAASILGLGFSNPAEAPFITALWALSIAFFSATQDIILDAYRVEILEEEQYGAGAAMFVFGYRLGMLVSGAGALYLAAFWGWSFAHIIVAACIAVGAVAILVGPRPFIPVDKNDAPENVLKEALLDPFKDFMKREQWLFILFFVIIYKLGDATAGVMTNPFYIDIGFDKTDIANISKAFGLAATLIGGFIGGVLVTKRGIIPSLYICGFLQMLSNLLFMVLAWTGKSYLMLIATIGFENFSGGMGSAAFVAYLSILCSKKFTATQYALLASLAAFGRTFVSSSSGMLADAVSWDIFFFMTTLIAIPGIVMIRSLKRT
ncbi:MAG: AmpG family muropeptide MFS transporter [Alphaproteobacteria bacterium]